MLKSQLLKIELPAGTNIEEACDQLIGLSRRLAKLIVQLNESKQANESNPQN